MTEKKGHAYTVRSVASLVRSKPGLKIRLDVIGGGPLLEEMRARIVELGMHEKIFLHGALQPSQVKEMLGDRGHLPSP